MTAARFSSSAKKGVGIGSGSACLRGQKQRGLSSGCSNNITLRIELCQSRERGRERKHEVHVCTMVCEGEVYLLFEISFASSEAYGPCPLSCFDVCVLLLLWAGAWVCETVASLIPSSPHQKRESALQKSKDFYSTKDPRCTRTSHFNFPPPPMPLSLRHPTPHHPPHWRDSCVIMPTVSHHNLCFFLQSETLSLKKLSLISFLIVNEP